MTKKTSSISSSRVLIYCYTKKVRLEDVILTSNRSSKYVKLIMNCQKEEKKPRQTMKQFISYMHANDSIKKNKYWYY